MATTNDNLLLQIQLNTSEAVAQLTHITQQVKAFEDASDAAAKEVQANMRQAADEIISKTVQIRSSLDEYGKSAAQIVQMRIAGELEEIRYLESHLQMNGQLTDSMRSQLEVAKQARQAQAAIAKDMDKTAIIDKLKSQQLALKAVIDSRGKSEIELAQMERVRELEKLNILELELAKEGRLTQAIVDQIRATKDLINTNAQQKQNAASPAASGAAAALPENNGSIKSLALDLVGFEAAIGLAKEGLHLLKEGFDETVGRFLAAESATKNLANVMAVMGSKDLNNAVKGMQTFAEKLSNTTVISKDLAIELLQQAKAVGISDDAAQKLVKTSVSVAAAYGKTIPEAFMALEGSLRGNARELSRMDPALKEAGEDALKAGKGIDYFAARLDGLAESQAKTFTGAMTQMKNNMEEIMKDLGESIAVGLGFEAGASSFADLIRDLKEKMQSWKVDIATALKQIVVFFSEAAKGIFGFFELIFGKIIYGFGTVVSAVGKGVGFIKGIFSEDTGAPEFIKDAGDAMRDFGKAADETGADMFNTFDPLKGALITTADVAKEMEERASRARDSAVKAHGDISGMLGSSKKLQEEMKKAADELRKSLEEIGSTALARSPSEEDKIVAAYQKQAYQLGIQLDNLNKLGLFDKNRTAIVQALATIQENMARDIQALHDKALNEEMKGYDEKIAALAKVTLSASDLGKLEEMHALHAIDLREQQHRQAGTLTAEVKGLLDVEKAITLELFKQTLNAEQQQKMSAILGGMVTQRKDLLAGSETELEVAQREAVFALSKIQMLRQELEDAKKLTDERRAQLDAAEATQKAYNEIKLGSVDRTFKEAAGELIDSISSTRSAFGFLFSEGVDNLIENAKASGKAMMDVVDKGMDVLTSSFTSTVISPLSAVFEGLSTGEFRALDDFTAATTKLMQGGFSLDNVSDVIGASLLVAFQDGAAVINGVLTGKWLQNTADLFQGIADMPANLGKIFDQLGTALDSIVKSFPAAMSALIDRIPAVFAKLADALPKIAQMLAAAVPALIGGLAKAAPALAKGIMDALPMLIEGFAQAFAKLADAMPAIIDALVKGLPRVIQAFMHAIPEIINALMAAIPDIVATLAQNIGPIIEAFIQGLIGGMGSIVSGFIDSFITKGGAVKIVVEIVKAIPQIVIALVNGFINGIADFFKNLFGDAMKINVPPEFKHIGNQISDGFKQGMKALSGAGSQLFKVSDLAAAASDPFLKAKGEVAGLVSAFYAAAASASGILSHWAAVITDIWNHWKDVISNVWKGFLADLNHWGDVIASIWKDIVKAITSAFQWVYDNVVQPLINGITAAWKWVYDNIVHPLITGMQAAWAWVQKNVIAPITTGLAGAWMWIIDNIITPLTSGIKAAWTWADTNVIQPFTLALRTVWTWVYNDIILPINKVFGDLFYWVYYSIFEPAVKIFQDMWNWVNANIIAPLSKLGHDAWVWVEAHIVSPLTTMGKDAFEWVQTNIVTPLSTIGSDAFAWVQTYIVSPLSTVGQDAFQWVEDHIVKPLQSVGSSFSGNGGELGKLTGGKLAGGGIIAGVAAVAGDSEINDKILALLSPGEAVIPRSKMADPHIRALIQAILSNGLKIPQFAIGGMVSAGGPSIGSLAVAASGMGGGQQGGGGQVIQNITQHMKFEGVQVPDQNFIRQKLMPTIKEELRRASLDGKAILYKQGLRSSGK